MAPVACVNRTASGLVSLDGSTPRRFHGAGLTAGAAAVVEIRDGGATGTILWAGRVGAAGEIDSPFSDRGIATANGVYVNIVSGTPTVWIYVS
ncbi:MAG TPA: hypothetical protein VNO79_03250 [Actinomycetota bacterium]|nr:hypothetical protein [Actinomycetota bacterium]